MAISYHSRIFPTKPAANLLIVYANKQNNLPIYPQIAQIPRILLSEYNSYLEHRTLNNHSPFPPPGRMALPPGRRPLRDGAWAGGRFSGSPVHRVPLSPPLLVSLSPEASRLECSRSPVDLLSVLQFERSEQACALSLTGEHLETLVTALQATRVSESSPIFPGYARDQGV
jgi:hypothetical protein